MIKLLITLFLYSSTSLAYTISVQGEGELTECSSDSSEKMYHCSNSAGEQFLIKENRWEFIALKKTNTGKFKSLEVYDIYNEENDDSIYTARFDMNNFLEEEEVPEYKGLVSDYIHNERYIYNNFFKDQSISKSLDKESKLFNFFNQAKREIEDKKERVDNALKSKDFNVVLKDDQTVKCSQSSLPSCPILSCNDDKNGEKRIILNNSTSLFIYLESFAIRNGSLAVSNTPMQGLYDNKGHELISYRDKAEEVFTPNMLVPAKYKNNPKLFKDLINPNYKSFISSHLKSCDKKTIKLFNDFIDEVQTDLNNFSMLQYIDMAKGILESNYINKDSIPGSACYHRGAYYAPDAYKKSKELESMSRKTISQNKAKELFSMLRDREDIAWNYTLDGCYARAHLMAKILEDQEIHVDKAWLRGSLQIPGKSKGMTWGYHVAPLVYVEGENGEVKEMIIDPSVAKGPISPKEWSKKMDVDFDETKQVSYPTPTNTSFYKKTSYSVTNSTPYWPDYNEKLSDEDKLQMATQRMLEYGAAPSEDF